MWDKPKIQTCNWAKLYIMDMGFCLEPLKHKLKIINQDWLSVFSRNILPLSSQAICRWRQWNPSLRLHGTISRKTLTCENFLLWMHFLKGDIVWNSIHMHCVTTDHLWCTLRYTVPRVFHFECTNLKKVGFFLVSLIVFQKIHKQEFIQWTQEQSTNM